MEPGKADANHVRRRNRKKAVNECCVFAKFVKNEVKAQPISDRFFVALANTWVVPLLLKALVSSRIFVDLQGLFLCPAKLFERSGVMRGRR